MAGNDVTINVKTKGTKKAKSAFGDLAKGAGKLGLAFGAIKVVQFGLDAVGAFSDLEESVNAVTVVYGEQSDAIFRLGKDSAETFGITTREVNDAAVQMQLFAEKIDEANPAGAFGNIIQRATDFASVMNIDTKEALDKFQSGLSGQSKPLKEFGLDISDAATQLFALENGIGTVDGKLTESEKVQARYGLIMEQTRKTAGDFANTSDDLANSQKILNAKWKEAQTEVGAKLAPLMLVLMAIATDLIPLFGRVVDVVGNLVAGVLPLVELIGSAVRLIGEYDAAVAAATSTETLGEDVGILEFAFRGLSSAMTGIPIIKERVDAEGKAAGRAASQIDLLKTAHEKIESAALRLEGRLPKTADAVEDLGEEFTEVADRGRDAFNAVETLQDQMRSLVDPVFRAKDATDRYNEALATSREDAITTAEEFAELVELYGEMEAAEAQVGVENIAAVADQAGNVARDIGAAAEVLPGFMESLTGFDARAFGAAEELVERIEKLTDKPLDFSVRLTAPSRTAIRRLLNEEFNRLRREGVLALL